jgi:hypothetical protein
LAHRKREYGRHRKVLGMPKKHMGRKMLISEFISNCLLDNVTYV